MGVGAETAIAENHIARPQMMVQLNEQTRIVTIPT